MEIYVDGSKSVNEELKISLVGFKNGIEILKYCDRIPFIGDSMLSEQVALIIAMKFIEKFCNSQEIIIYSDQLYYVELLNSNIFSTKALHKHEFAGYMLNIYSYLPKVKIKHVKSSKNKADKVMNKKMRCDYYLKTEHVFRGIVDEFRQCANKYSYMNEIGTSLEYSLINNKGADNVQKVLKAIREIIKENDYSMKVYSDKTIVFYIYEGEVPIVIDLKKEEVFLDCEIFDLHLTADELSELSMVSKLLEDNINYFTAIY